MNILKYSRPIGNYFRLKSIVAVSKWTSRRGIFRPPQTYSGRWCNKKSKLILQKNFLHTALELEDLSLFNFKNYFFVRIDYHSILQYLNSEWSMSRLVNWICWRHTAIMKLEWSCLVFYAEKIAVSCICVSATDILWNQVSCRIAGEWKISKICGTHIIVNEPCQYAASHRRNKFRMWNTEKKKQKSTEEYVLSTWNCLHGEHMSVFFSINIVHCRVEQMT